MRNVIEEDPDVCSAIVCSMRLYVDACEHAGKLPQMLHLVEILYAEDSTTKAFIEAKKMGPDDVETT